MEYFRGGPRFAVAHDEHLVVGHRFVPSGHVVVTRAGEIKVVVRADTSKFAEGVARICDTSDFAVLPIEGSLHLKVQLAVAGLLFCDQRSVELVDVGLRHLFDHVHRSDIQEMFALTYVR